MLRLIMICTTIVLSCLLVGSYLAGSDSPVQSIQQGTDTHVLKANSAADGEAKIEKANVENADTVEEASDGAAGDGGSADDDESADDDAASDNGGFAGSNPPPSTDPWNPGQLPGEPGK